MARVENNNYFPALTGVRAVAAFMVFLHHYNPFTSFGQDLYHFVNEFHVGVALFFVLSGFLITLRYYSIRKNHLWTYFVNRFSRIYPMYFLLTTVTFIVTRQEHGFDLYLLNITFLKGLFNHIKFSGIAQGWTLTVEEIFYVLAPFIYLVLRKLSVRLIFLIPVIFYSMGAALVMIFKKYDFLGFFENLEFMHTYTLFGRAFEFFVGAVLAFIFINYKAKFRFHFATWLGMVGICLSLLGLSIARNHLELPMQEAFTVIINNFILPVVGIGPFYWGLLTEQSMVQKILSTRFFELLGKSSYTFYLIHLGFIATYISGFIHHPLALFIILNIIAILLYKFIEEPLKGYLRFKLRKRVTAAVS